MWQCSLGVSNSEIKPFDCKSSSARVLGLERAQEAKWHCSRKSLVALQGEALAAPILVRLMTTSSVQCPWESSCKTLGTSTVVGSLSNIRLCWLLKCTYGNYISSRTYWPLYLILTTYFRENSIENKKVGYSHLVRWCLRTEKWEKPQGFDHSGKCNGPWKSFSNLQRPLLIFLHYTKTFFPFKNPRSFSTVALH